MDLEKKFALLLEDNDDDEIETSPPIEYSETNDGASCLVLNQEVLASTAVNDKVGEICKYLRHHRESLIKGNSFEIVIAIDFNPWQQISLMGKHSEILLAIRYVLDYSQKFVTSLTLDIVSMEAELRNSLDWDGIFSDVAFDNTVLTHVFTIMCNAVRQYRLRDIRLKWAVNEANCHVFTHGLTQILTAEPQQPLNMEVLFNTAWLHSLLVDINYANTIGLMHAIRECRFDKFRLSLAFHSHENADLAIASSFFSSIAENVHIQQLQLDLKGGLEEHLVESMIEALANCMKNLKHNAVKTVENDDAEEQETCDFALMLDLRALGEQHTEPILRGLYDNDFICLTRLEVFQTGQWNPRTISVVCDILEETGQHQIRRLCVDGIFEPQYQFGMYKVVGFDKLVQCVTRESVNHDDEDEDEDPEELLELASLRVGRIVADEDSNVYHEYVVALIEHCNVWMSEVVITYDEFTSRFTDVIQAFFNHLRRVYARMKSIEDALSAVFETDVVQIVADFCKLDGFQICIVEAALTELNSTMLNNERMEFRDELYHFWRTIHFKYTPNDVAKNKQEFNEFANQISMQPIGIWTQHMKSAEYCVSLFV